MLLSTPWSSCNFASLSASYSFSCLTLNSKTSFGTMALWVVRRGKGVVGCNSGGGEGEW